MWMEFIPFESNNEIGYSEIMFIGQNSIDFDALKILNIATFAKEESNEWMISSSK